MFIAVTAEGKDLESQVSSRFDSCKYLLIVNMDNMIVESFRNENAMCSENLSKIIIERECEAVITGELNPEAFELMAGACITRYIGFGQSAKYALVLMEQYALRLIKNTEGTDECDGDHHGGHHHEYNY